MSRTLPVSEMMRDRAFRFAVGSMAVAVVVLVAAVTGAIRVQSVAAAAPPPTIPDSALRFALPGAGVDVAQAVLHDLFTDDRTPPPRRYRLPGEAEPVARAPSPRPTVLGTAVGGADDGFAICQMVGGQPTIVRVGQRIGDFTVLTIERTRVVFRGPDGERLSIDASKP